MAEVDRNVTPIPRALPAEIIVPRSDVGNFTADELDRLKEVSGVSLNVTLGDDDDRDNLPNRIRAQTWLALRRAGYDVSWADAGRVLFRIVDVEPDPTSGG